MTDVQYAKMINYLRSVSELLCVDDEIIFMNLISDYYAAFFVSETNVKKIGIIVVRQRYYRYCFDFVCLHCFQSRKCYLQILHRYFG